MNHLLLVIVFLVLMLPGLAGIFLPLVPSVPYMLLVALIFGLIDKFTHLSLGELVILGILGVASFLVDHLSGVVGAKYSGASKRSLLWGIIGAILGTVVLPPFGGIAGVFIGVLISEWSLHKDKTKAVKVAGGSLIGNITGMIVNLILAITFLALFVIFALN